MARIIAGLFGFFTFSQSVDRPDRLKHDGYRLQARGVCQMGLEGVVSKRLSSPFTSRIQSGPEGTL
jgi:hypothetical protein